MTCIHKIIEEVKDLCINNNIDSSHGVDHAISVMNNALYAIESYEGIITEIEKYMIIIAALLHDTDDNKYFPQNYNNENARKILNNINEFNKDQIEIIIKMINFVSTSKNKDNIPNNYPEWYFIPRYSDRLEAIGIIGVERALEYSFVKGQPLFLENTLRAKTLDELWLIATQERYINYKGDSKSMFDHIYDKLLHMNNFPIRNKYFDNQCCIKMQPLIELSLEFGKNENGMTKEQVSEFIRKYNI
jgi:uncharacterized protein